MPLDPPSRSALTGSLSVSLPRPAPFAPVTSLSHTLADFLLLTLPRTLPLSLRLIPALRDTLLFLLSSHTGYIDPSLPTVHPVRSLLRNLGASTTPSSLPAVPRSPLHFAHGPPLRSD